MIPNETLELWGAGFAPQTIRDELSRLGYNKSQRAMVGARLLKHTNMTMVAMADMMKVSRPLINDAMAALRYASIEEIIAIEEGRTSTRRIVGQYRERSVVDRKERFSDRSNLFYQFKQAIDIICGLPQPADIARIVNQVSKNRSSFDDRITAALKWMEQYNEQRGDPNAFAETDKESTDHNPDSRDGDAVTREEPAKSPT